MKYDCFPLPVPFSYCAFVRNKPPNGCNPRQRKHPTPHLSLLPVVLVTTTNLLMMTPIRRFVFITHMSSVVFLGSQTSLCCSFSLSLSFFLYVVLSIPNSLVYTYPVCSFVRSFVYVLLFRDSIASGRFIASSIASCPLTSFHRIRTSSPCSYPDSC